MHGDGLDIENRRCELDVNIRGGGDTVLTIATACTGICLGGGHLAMCCRTRPNGGRSCRWQYGTANGLIAPCGRVCGGKGTTPCRPLAGAGQAGSATTSGP
jgi:hypothetical protein